MIITYVGKEQCDILYHLIMIGSKMGKTIAVLDNSINHDLFSIFAEDETADLVETHGIVVGKDYTFKREQKTYDFVFIYEGLLPRYEGYTDFSIIAPSYAKNEWDMIKDHAKGCEQAEIRTFLVLRDKINRKISDKVALAKLDFDPTFMMNTEFNEKDYSSYISLTHNKAAKLSPNGEIYEVICMLCEELYHVNEKNLKNYL